MKEAILNGVCVFFCAIAGAIAGVMLGIILPWPALAAVAGGIIVIVLGVSAMSALQLRKIVALYRQAVQRLEEGK